MDHVQVSGHRDVGMHKLPNCHNTAHDRRMRLDGIESVTFVYTPVSQPKTMQASKC